MQGAEFINNSISLIPGVGFADGEQAFEGVGKTDDMLVEVTSVVRAEVMVANNGQNGREGGEATEHFRPRCW